MVKRPRQVIGGQMTNVFAVTSRIAYHWTYWPGSCQLVAVSRGPFQTQLDGLTSLWKKESQVPLVPSFAGGHDSPTLDHARPGEWSKKFPILCGYLLDGAWPDGTPRKPGKVFISPSLGKWEFTLKETNHELVLVVVVEEPHLGLEALEAALGVSVPPWRPDPWGKAGRRKK